MFSLIITLIAIALVAALALATLYYGGDALTKGQASARSAEIINQGQQLLSAMEMYRLDNGKWPDSLAQLVPNYVKQIPSMSAQAAGLSVGTAHAESSSITWALPAAGVPTILLSDPVSTEVCQEVNRNTRGDNGILKRAYTSLATQCYGQDNTGLKVVLTKVADSLGTTLPPEEIAPDPTVPDVTVNPDDWLVVPGTDGTGTGGGAGNGGGGGTEDPWTPSVKMAYRNYKICSDGYYLNMRVEVEKEGDSQGLSLNVTGISGGIDGEGLTLRSSSCNLDSFGYGYCALRISATANGAGDFEGKVGSVTVQTNLGSAQATLVGTSTFSECGKAYN